MVNLVLSVGTNLQLPFLTILLRICCLADEYLCLAFLVQVAGRFLDQECVPHFDLVYHQQAAFAVVILLILLQDGQAKLEALIVDDFANERD
jgi:hypothetical protein